MRGRSSLRPFFMFLCENIYMKRISIVLLIQVAVAMYGSHTVQAQSWKNRSAEDKARYYTKQMAEDLSLDDSVIIKVYQINLEVSKKFDSLYAKKNNPESRKGAALIYQFRNEAYRDVLSTKQYLKFEDMERERREKRKKEQEEKEAKRND